MEPCVGLARFALDRGGKRGLRGRRIAFAHHDTKKGPGSSVVGIGGERVSTTGFRSFGVAPLPRGARVAKRDPCGVVVGAAHFGLARDCSAPKAASSSSVFTRATTLDQSPGRGWRNSRSVGYHGLSSRASCQRQSGAKG